MPAFTYGQLPKVSEILTAVGPDPYPIRNVTAMPAIVRAINQGIDSHLEAVLFKDLGLHRTPGMPRWCGYHQIIEITPESMPALLRRLVEAWEDGDDEAGDDASAILGTLGWEWI